MISTTGLRITLYTMRIHVSCTTRHICWAWTNEYMNNAGEGMNLVQKKSDMASTPSKSMSKSAQACDTQKGKNHRREVMSKTNFSHFYIHANLHEKSLHVTVPASSVYVSSCFVCVLVVPYISDFKKEFESTKLNIVNDEVILFN